MNVIRHKLKDMNNPSGAMPTQIHSSAPQPEVAPANDRAMQRKIRLLENKLDKSIMKYNEAISMKETYSVIVKQLREDKTKN